MYYEKLSKLPCEEDMTHEFKGHRNVCIEEIPKWALASKGEKASRKPISRNLCGFLNTGKGGTVYCGVADDGMVHGLKLTQYQRDHIVGGLHDVMSRYSPPVPSYRYKVKFVPVFSATTSKEQRSAMLNYKPSDYVDEEDRHQKHVFRSPEYCWCDKDAIAQFQNEILISDYVVEIIILPWDPDDGKNEGLGAIFNLHPIHENEQGDIYFRNQASLCQYTLQEISNLTRLEVRIRKDDILRRLKEEISLLKKSLENSSTTSKEREGKTNIASSPP